MRYQTLFTATLAAGLTVAAMCSAATVHTSHVSFAAAAPQSSDVILPNTGGQGATGTVGPLTFTAGPGATNVFFGTAGLSTPIPGGWSSLLSGNDLAISGPENFELNVAGGAYALGFEIHEPTLDQNTTDGCFAVCFDTELFVEWLRGGTVIASQTVFPIDNGLSFVGYTDAVAFDGVRVTDVTNTIDEEHFGNFQLAQTPVPVPLPATGMVLFGGLMAAFARRRAR